MASQYIILIRRVLSLSLPLIWSSNCHTQWEWEFAVGDVSRITHPDDWFSVRTCLSCPVKDMIQWQWITDIEKRESGILDGDSLFLQKWLASGWTWEAVLPTQKAKDMASTGRGEEKNKKHGCKKEGGKSQWIKREEWDTTTHYQKEYPSECFSHFRLCILRLSSDYSLQSHQHRRSSFLL